MKNAHLRLTQVEYSVQSKNWSTRVEVCAIAGHRGHHHPHAFDFRQ